MKRVTFLGGSWFGFVFVDECLGWETLDGGFKKGERDREPSLCLVFKPFTLEGKKGMPSLSHVAFIILSTAVWAPHPPFPPRPTLPFDNN